MIGIPLHTTTTKDGKVIANVETKYDDPANLLPTSVLSHDLQNRQSVRQKLFIICMTTKEIFFSTR